MEDILKKTYTILSGGKQISSGEYIISANHFNSITRDRFVAELHKNGILWDGRDIAFNKLLYKDISVNENGVLQDSFNTPAADNGITANASTTGYSIGIDIQDINEMPAADDYWEDSFYRMKFTPAEIAHCLKKENAIQSFAGIYACKEALIKCNNELEWNGIALSFNQFGKPLCKDYQVSISHSGNFAVAVAFKYPGINNKQAFPVPAVASGENAPVTEHTPPPVEAKPGKYYPLAFVIMLAVIAYFIYRDFISNK